MKRVILGNEKIYSNVYNKTWPTKEYGTRNFLLELAGSDFLRGCCYVNAHV